MRLNKKHSRRTLAWLLALIMVLSLMPVPAFADEASSNIITEFETLDKLTANQYWV